MHWVDRASGEVSGLGKVQFIDGCMVVTSVYLLEQENTSSSTDIDPQAIAKLMYEAREEEGHLNFWWHSHVNMSCFWSKTDDEAITQLGEHGWVLSTVVNKKRELRTAYYQKGNDFYPPIFYDEIDTELKFAGSVESKKLDEEFDKKCKTKTYSSPYSSKFPSNKSTHAWSDDAWDGDYFDTYNSDIPTLTDSEEKELEEHLSRSMVSKRANEVDKYKRRQASREPILPSIVYRNESKLPILSLSRHDKKKWARAYHDFHGEYTEEWSELDEFYQEWKDQAIID